MSSIEITTTIGCRINCAYCPQDKINKAYAARGSVFQMGLDVFKACIDKIPPSVVIYFSGMCEPWLNPECTKMLLYAHETGHRIGVFTSLVGMGLSDISLLEPIPFTVFCVHLPSDKGREGIKIDKNYLEVLEKLAKSKISPSYVVFNGAPKQDVKALLRNKIVARLKVCSRGRNIEMESMALPKRRRGAIGCALNLRGNMLLPNGDVILCCVDYGMKHVLGNLLTSDYDSLFRGEEFLRIKRGLRDESEDILCRYCEEYAYNANLFTRSFVPLVYNLKNFRSLRVLYRSLFRSVRKLSRFLGEKIRRCPGS